MANRKQRRNLQRVSRQSSLRTNDLSKVAELLKQVEGHKQDIAEITSETKQVKGFARVLCTLADKVEPTLLDSLDQEDTLILESARALMGKG
jgi:hypothetical protein